MPTLAYEKLETSRTVAVDRVQAIHLVVSREIKAL